MAGKLNKLYYTKKIETTNDFEKIFYKSMNNTFYGKSMEIVRNSLKVKIIKNDDDKKSNKNNENWPSKEFITTIQTIIAIHLSKTKCLWIDPFF